MNPNVSMFQDWDSNTLHSEMVLVCSIIHPTRRRRKFLSIDVGKQKWTQTISIVQYFDPRIIPQTISAAARWLPSCFSLVFSWIRTYNLSKKLSIKAKPKFRKSPFKSLNQLSISHRINHYFEHIKSSSIESNLSFFFIQNRKLSKFLNEIFIHKSLV